MLKAYYKKGQLEAGTDEAGRGCLAGPVVAAAVILPEDFTHPLLNDSKQLSEKQRYALREVVEKEAICYGVAFVDNNEIDKINILKASFSAMHRSIDKLSTTPEYILVDGNRFVPYNDIPHSCIIKGDGKYLSIAAASILAKTYRDDYMQEIGKRHPEYNWASNKGYPTIAHRKAIKEFGTTPFHRMSFRLLPNQLSLFDKP